MDFGGPVVSNFDPPDPNFEVRVRGNFARQGLLRTIGASLRRVAPGEVEVVLPFRDDLCQQHGFIGAGIVATIADIACGYAAMSLWGADSDGLTVEFKINFLAPAKGERLIARARVTRSGRTVSVCAADVFAVSGQETLVATMLATLIQVPGERAAEARNTEGRIQQVEARDVVGREGHAPRRWCVCGGRGVRGAIREFMGGRH
jgi:uncharacterized protein (TIGR00369 family)